MVASLRGLSANLASLLFSPAVGRWCNRHPSRLLTLQVCIVFQRICIFLACVGWSLIVQAEGADLKPHSNRDGLVEDSPAVVSNDHVWIKHLILSLSILLGMLEKLSAVGNLLVMERDWVPLLATPTTRPALHVLNASLKRIDLISKLVAPLAISAVALGLHSLKLTALIIAAMQVLSLAPEVLAANRVWRSCKRLHEPRRLGDVIITADGEDLPIPGTPVVARPEDDQATFARGGSGWTRSLHFYFNSVVCIPSLALAIQPFSVLTLSASMTTYLLNAHYSLSMITTARVFSTGVEISSTILTPLLISWLNHRSSRKNGQSHEPLRPLTRVGLYGLWWQLFTLFPVTFALVALPNTAEDPAKAFPVLTSIIFVFIGLSRLGPFGYGLVEQTLVQIVIPASQRVDFSGVEMAFVSLAELSRWALTAIWGHPEQFKGVAIAAIAGIAIATIMFWRWSWKWWATLSDLHHDCVSAS